MIKKIEKMHPSSVGFLQAVGVGIYCFLIGSLLRFLETTVEPPQIWAITILLFLFVISAAITGTFVFGYSVYLTIKQKIKRALSVMLFTLIFSILLVFVALFTFVI